MTTTLHRPNAVPQFVVDGALLLTGQGVASYRSTFPSSRARDGCRVQTTSPSRIATHVVAGFLLGLATVAVLIGLVLALLVSPLLLAPAGGVSLLAFAGIGAGHGTLTRRLVDRT